MKMSFFCFLIFGRLNALADTQPCVNLLDKHLSKFNLGSFSKPNVNVSKIPHGKEMIEFKHTGVTAKIYRNKLEIVESEKQIFISASMPVSYQNGTQSRVILIEFNPETCSLVKVEDGVLILAEKTGVYSRVTSADKSSCDNYYKIIKQASSYGDGGIDIDKHILCRSYFPEQENSKKANDSKGIPNKIESLEGTK